MRPSISCTNTALNIVISVLGAIQVEQRRNSVVQGLTIFVGFEYLGGIQGQIQKRMGHPQGTQPNTLSPLPNSETVLVAVIPQPDYMHN